MNERPPEAGSWTRTAHRFYARQTELKRNPRRYRTFTRAYRRVGRRLDLRPNDRLLDAGCGAGELAAALGARPGLVCGIDLCHESLALAAERNPHARFIQTDAGCLPFPDASFDHAAAITSVEFCPDRLAVLREIRRALRPGGRLYLEVRNADFVLWRTGAPLLDLARRWGLITPYPADGFRDLGYAEWHNLLAQAGFTVERVTSACRPALYGDPLTRLKNILIAVLAAVTPPPLHYMTGFVCRATDSVHSPVAPSETRSRASHAR